MKIRYIGPHLQVEIAAIGVRVGRNQQVDVPAELARDLVKQADWKKVTKTKDED